MAIFCCALSACTKVDPNLVQQLQLQSVNPSQPPMDFNILGASGNLDLISDVNLYSTTSPIISWSASGGATGYTAKIYDMTDTEVCSGDDTNAYHYFAGCLLLDGASYKIKVTAQNSNGTKSASNDGFVFTVDNTVPTVLKVDSPTTPAIWKEGQTVSIRVLFSEQVNVTGSNIKLALNTTPARYATLVSTAPDGSANFNYVVQTGDHVSLLANIDANSLIINSSTTFVRDSHGNLASTVLPVPGATNALDDLTAITIDGAGPEVDIAFDHPFITNATFANVSGNCSDLGSGLNGGQVMLCIKMGGGCSSASDFTIPTTCSAGTYNYEWNISGDGIYNVAVRAEDGVGHVNTQGLTSSVTIDQTAPAAFYVTGVTGTTDTLLDSYKSDTSPLTINWVVATGASDYDVQIQDVGTSTMICSGNSAGAGVTSITFGPECVLTEGGTYAYYVTARDTAGNVTSSGNNGDTFIVDTTGPVASIGAASPTAINSSAESTMNLSFTEVSNPPMNLQVDVLSGAASCSVGTSGFGSNYIIHLMSCTGNGTVQVRYLAGSASDAAGNTNAEAVGPVITVDNVAPAAPVIRGITGGTDVTEDNLLYLTSTPVINWNIAVGADAYGVSIKSADLSTTPCPEQIVTSTSYNFSGCLLANQTQFVARVRSLDNANNSAYSDFAFYVLSSVPTTTVASRYPSNGSRWNDYVKNDGTNAFMASDTSCDTSASSRFDSCIHGGEMRSVQTIFDSCANLSISETLDLFDWQCVVLDYKATFVSKGLKSGKKLADLLNLVATPAWKLNSVTIKLGSIVVGNPTSAAWWSNSVAQISSVSVTNITLASSINVVTSNIIGAGISINADKAAVVVAPGYTYSFSQLGANANGSAETGTGYAAVLFAGSQKFLWIEGDYAGYSGTYSAPAQMGFYLSTVTHSQIRNVNITKLRTSGAYGGLHLVLNSSKNKFSDFSLDQGFQYGIYMSTSSYNDFNNFSMTSPANGYHGIFVVSNSNGNAFSLGHIDNVSKTANTNGVYMASSTANIFKDISISSFYSYGVSITSGSSFNWFSGVRIDNMLYGSGVGIADSNLNVFESTSLFNGAGHGFLISGTASSNIINRWIVANSASNGIFVSSSSANSNIFNLGTVINGGSGGSAVYINASASGNVINQLLSVNNSKGVTLIGATSTTISQYVGHNYSSFYGGGLYFSDASNSLASGNVLKGNFILGSATGNCSGFSASTDVINTTLCDSNGGTGMVGGTFWNLRPASNDLVARLDSNDSLNLFNDGNGQAAFASLLDYSQWSTFLNPFRGWGKVGFAFPNPDFSATGHRGNCNSLTCAIWDVRLKVSASVVRNTSGAGTDSSQNETFVEGGPCPTAVDGNRSITVGVFTFLMNAAESPTEGTGNHNGLCESGDTCIYQPNYGAYLGEGPLTNACSFQNGTVSGVVMKAYTQNGAF